MTLRLLPPKRGGFFTIEFGNYGWGATPKASLPHQRGFGFFRVSWGRGDIAQGILSQMHGPKQP